MRKKAAKNKVIVGSTFGDIIGRSFGTELRFLKKEDIWNYFLIV